ncbi:MAG TPA: nuclear transport factor 2 family protein [Nevskia sp.]|nr:nuclear transport factor 2 family protein [Nevskia sp.]
MRRYRAITLSLLCAAAALPFTAAAAAPASCESRLPHPPVRDEQSVRDAEHAWLVAEMGGDSATLQCLLDEGYTNLGFDGKTYGKADIVSHAAKNQGKNLPVPTVELSILVHGRSATAWSVQQKHDGEGKPITVFFSDSLEFRNGAWHPYFSVDAVAAPGAQIKD